MTIETGAILIRNGECKKVIEQPGKNYKFLFESETVEANVAQLEPGFESRLFKHGGEETHIVLKGEVEYTVGMETYKLNEGDILWHRSDIEHKAKNNSDGNVTYLTIGTPPTFKPSMA